MAGKPPAKSKTYTRREREVLARLARGETNVQIARALGVGYETVKTYVSRIRAKPHAGLACGSNRAALVAFARRLQEQLPHVDPRARYR